MTELVLPILAIGYGLAAGALKIEARAVRLPMTVAAYLAPTIVAWSPPLMLIAIVLAAIRLVTHRRGGVAAARFAIEHVPQIVIVVGLVTTLDVAPQIALAGAIAPWWQVPDAAEPMMFIAAALIVAAIGGEFVATVLNPRRAADEDAGPAGRGRTIGILERLLILTLVVMDQWSGIAFVIAAKSLARFKEFDDREFAEYYLVGTLTSALFAIAVGLGLTLV